jgi:hypothetical protein
MSGFVGYFFLIPLKPFIYGPYKEMAQSVFEFCIQIVVNLLRAILPPLQVKKLVLFFRINELVAPCWVLAGMMTRMFIRIMVLSVAELGNNGRDINEMPVINLPFPLLWTQHNHNITLYAPDPLQNISLNSQIVHLKRFQILACWTSFLVRVEKIDCPLNEDACTV